MHDVRSDAPRRRRPGRSESFSFVTRHPPMLVGLLAAVDAALFTAIGGLHLGASVGDFSAPRAHWAAPVELFGALCCTVCAGAVWTRAPLSREIAWIANGIALWCVMLGVLVFTAGLDPCTQITDVHYSMTASVTLLNLWRMSRWQRGLSWPP